MQNKVGHEGAQPSHNPSSVTSQDSIPQNHRQVEETPTVDSNNSSSSSINIEELEQVNFRMEWRLEQIAEILGSIRQDNQNREGRVGVQHDVETPAVDNNNNNSSSYIDEIEQTFSRIERRLEQMAEILGSISQDNQNREGRAGVQPNVETPAVDNSSSSSSYIDEIEQTFSRIERRLEQMAEILGSMSQDNQNREGRARVQYDVETLFLLNPGPTNTDDMNYEELMELLERTGKVQIGLSKETISSHLKTRVHATTFVDSSENMTEICIICQDKYENKDKIGSLDCKHEYHEDCITQWLVQKNVCPICKRQGLKTMEENKRDVNGC